MARRPALLTLAVMLLSCPATRAAVIRVPADQPTIQAGVTAASPGDTVLIAPNTYHEHGIVVTEAVTIAGDSSDPADVTLDGGGTEQIVSFQGTTGALVRHITFTNGGGSWGGAVECELSSVTFESCVLRDNHASAAIFIENGSGNAQLFSDCRFTGNVSDGSGGAVFVEMGSAIFTDCTFEDNVADGLGGAMLVDDDTQVQMTDCSFTGNGSSLTSWGGAVYCYEDCSLAVVGCDFTDNTADDGAGALCVDTGTSADIDSCDFVGNSAAGAYGHAGALYVDGAQPLSITSCSFRDNEAHDWGAAYLYECLDVTFEHSTFVSNSSEGSAALGIDDTPMTVSHCLFAANTGVWGGGIEIWDSDPVDLEHCTISGNTMTGSGGGCAVTVYGISENPVVTLDGCAVSGNTGGDPVFCDDGSAVVYCSTVWGNASGDWVGAIAGQDALNDNMTEDPLFCGAASGDFGLCADSPCLPANNDCGLLIGPYDEGCPACGSPVEAVSWGAIKALYRGRSNR